MLEIIVPAIEAFDESSSEFKEVLPAVKLELEHSLVVLSKWEKKFKKPFLSKEHKTPEEVFGYVEAMIQTPSYPENILQRMTQTNLDAINEYIESTESATTFRELPKKPGNHEIVTSELIYYWMVAFNIPAEYENWHLNRLFSLIRIASIKNSKPTKQSRSQMADERRRANEQRRQQLNTTG
ncbi:hypothetical protein KC887_04135 [Candidatus Kaiserbacteria bacterium]|nr:hypothetical protein [Candidatus Kaiserbacteria bacterium]